MSLLARILPIVVTVAASALAIAGSVLSVSPSPGTVHLAASTSLTAPARWHHDWDEDWDDDGDSYDYHYHRFDHNRYDHNRGDDGVIVLHNLL